MDTSPDAHSAISHEAIDTWIYAHPKKTFIEHGICLPSRRWIRKKPLSKRPQTPNWWDATDRLKRTDIADRKIPGNWEGNLIIEACRYFCLSYVRPWPVKLLRISLAYRSRPAMESDMNLPACIGSYIGVCCCATTVVSQRLAD